MNDSHANIEELLAFLCDGDSLSPDTQQHLDGCQFCQRQVASYQNIAACLLSQLYRRDCPSAATLSAFCLPGALTADEQHQISTHLAICPLCAAELAETRQFLEAS